jgi:hypothetical protein
VILAAVGVLLPAALLRWRDPVLGRLVDDPGLAVRNAALIQGYSPSGLLTGIAPAWSSAVEVVSLADLLLGLLALVAARRAKPFHIRIRAVGPGACRCGAPPGCRMAGRSLLPCPSR